MNTEFPDPPLSENAKTFLAAWRVWDDAASRISLLAEIEHRRGKYRRPSEFALKAETDYFVDRTAVFANELGVNPVHLMNVLHALRREGIDMHKAIQKVILYLELPSENREL